MKLKLQLNHSELTTLCNISLIFFEVINEKSLENWLISDGLKRLHNRCLSRSLMPKKKYTISLGSLDTFVLNALLKFIEVNNYASFEQNFILRLKIELDKFKTNL